MKMQQKIKYLGSIIVISIFISLNLMAQSLYFSTPQESIEIASKLLLDEDWGKLSNYYFLNNSDKETIASLKNGSYFIRDKRPEIFHPGVNWKYKNPFPPNYKYLSHIELENDREPIPDGYEPELWFHEIFHKEGFPYKQEEVDLIKRLTSD